MNERAVSGRESGAATGFAVSFVVAGLAVAGAIVAGAAVGGGVQLITLDPPH